MSWFIVIAFLAAGFLLLWTVQRLSIATALRRLGPDPVERVIEGAFFAGLCGDLCLTRSQLVYLAMAQHNPQVGPLDLLAGPSLLGMAIHEARRKEFMAQRDALVASLLEVVGKVREEERNLTLPARLANHPACRVLDRSAVKTIERSGNAVELRCVKPKKLEYVFKDEDQARRAEAQLREWKEGLSLREPGAPGLGRPDQPAARPAEAAAGSGRGGWLTYLVSATAVVSLAATAVLAYLGRQAEGSLIREVAERHLLGMEGVRTAGTVQALHGAGIVALVTTAVLAGAALWLGRDALLRRGWLGRVALLACAVVAGIPYAAMVAAGDPHGPPQQAFEEQRAAMRARLEEAYVARAYEILRAWKPSRPKPFGEKTLDRPLAWLALEPGASPPPTRMSTPFGLGFLPQVLPAKLVPSILVAVTGVEDHPWAWNVAVFTWPEGEYLGSERFEGGKDPDIDGPASAWVARHDRSGCVMGLSPPPRCAEESLASEDPGRTTVLFDLGSFHEAFGQPERARAIYERVLAIQEKAHGEDHRALLLGLVSLATLDHLHGRYGQAEPLYRRAVAIAERHLGPDHAYVGMLLENLGAVYRVTGRDGLGAESEARAARIRATRR